MSISIEHLTKRYGTFTAIEDVSIDIPSGSVFGLLGPNGAGKTTTFKCMLGLARPTSGRTRFDGAVLAPAAFQNIAYVAERSVLYEWLRAGDHVEMQRRAFSRFDAGRAKQLMDLFALDPRKRVGSLSKGLRTALSVVLAFSIDPEIMILDEPTSGLDPLNARAVLKLIIEAAARGKTILFSSHQIGQVERAADHIAILQHGKVVLTGPVDDLKAGSKIVEAIFESEAVALGGLGVDHRVSRVEQTGRIVRLTVSADSDSIAQQLSAAGAQSVRVVDLNLEDIFVNAVDPAGVTADVVERV